MPRTLQNPSDIVGQRFGRLVPEEALPPTPYSYGQAKTRVRKSYRYRCVCDCGNRDFVVLRVNLLTGHTKSCGCNWKPLGSDNWRWSGHGQISGSYWGRLQRGAKARSIEFDLSFEDAWGLFQQQQGKCAITGHVLTLGPGQTASIDRIDNSLGYSLSNAQWVHKDINKMKGTLTMHQFKDWCRAVTTHLEGEAR